MTLVWTILGAILITVVLAFCITFSIVRPRLAKKVNAGATEVAKELHGRQPLKSTAASCEGCSDPDRMALKGVGVIALSEQALVFGSGANGTTVVIPRSKVTEVGPATSIEILGRSIRRARPMLLVRWNDGKDVNQLIAFTIDDPLGWSAAIPLPTSPVDQG